MRRNTIPALSLPKRRLLLIGASGLVLLVLVGYLCAFLSWRYPAVTGGRRLVLPGFPSQPSCTKPPQKPGESTVSLSSNGITRHFLLHLPPSYGDHSLPVVISYHGYSWTPQIMKQSTHTDAEADKAGFVLVLPEGVEQTWNAGVGTGDTNDVLFTSDLLTYLDKHYCVDLHKVYVMGFSLGGGMAYRVACALTDKITAIGTISGAYYPIPGGCTSSRPIPVLEIHGAADDLAPYAGNPTVGMAAVNDYLQGWRDRDQCTGSGETFFQKGDVTGIEWTHCAPNVQVVHYRISDGKHTWPTTHVIDPNALLWDFFNHFSLA